VNSEAPTEIATLAGGCFWCIEAIFREVEGVEQAVSGYAGGTTVNPTYHDVCSGQTGHAEAVRVTFDPTVITYRDILEIFFSVHDPTTLNRQGADVGTQYRSAIFYHDEEQKAIADALITELDEGHIWDRPIVTQVVLADEFYPAEEYHREYFLRNPNKGYCRTVISPKVSKFHRRWAERLKGPSG
jgi:peptide-methionine (S)-S-oxide reductase